MDEIFILKYHRKHSYRKKTGEQKNEKEINLIKLKA